MPDVDIGFSSLGNESYRTPLEQARGLPVDFVELTMNDHAPSVLSAHADDIRELVDAAEIGLTVHLPHGNEDNMLASSDDEIRQRSAETFRDALDAAGEIGARKAVIHVDAADHRLLLEVDRLADLVVAVDDLADYAAEHGIELCVENMRGTSRRRLCPDDVARLAVDTGAGMTLDTGHARTVGYSDDDIADFLERHADLVSHFHLNDTRGASDDHLPFGAGTTDFRRIFGALPDGWTGTLDLEVSVPTYEYVAISVEQLHQVLDDLDVTDS